MSKRFFALLITSAVSLLLATQPVQAATAHLQLTPTSLNLKPGETGQLTLTLKPQQLPVVGVDVFLIFDPSYITIESIQETGVFSMMPALNINNQAGQAKFSLAHTYGIHQLQTAKIATLTLKATSKQGSSNLNFQFTPGSTTDTNVVVAGGTDVLEIPNPVKITVKQASAGNNANNTNTSNSNSSNNSSNSSSQADPTPNPNILGFTDTIKSSVSKEATLSASESATPTPDPTLESTNPPQTLGLTDQGTQPPLTATPNTSNPWQLVLALGITLIIASSTTVGYWWGKHRANLSTNAPAFS